MVEFQPQTSTTPYLGSAAYCCIAYLLNPPHHLFLTSDVNPGEADHSCPSTPSIDLYLQGLFSCPVITRLRPRIPKIFTHLPLTCHFQITIPPPCSLPLHSCQFTFAGAPMLPPKSLLTWPSDVVQMSPASTTTPGPPTPLQTISHKHLEDRP